MPRLRINGNFIDKTFSIVANILLRIIPTTSGEVTPRGRGFCSVLSVNTTELVLIGSIGEEALHLGINNTKTLLEITPCLWGYNGTFRKYTKS